MKYIELIIKAKIDNRRCPRCDASGYNYSSKSGCCWRCALSYGDIEELNKIQVRQAK